MGLYAECAPPERKNERNDERERTYIIAAQPPTSRINFLVCQAARRLGHNLRAPPAKVRRIFIWYSAPLRAALLTSLRLVLSHGLHCNLHVLGAPGSINEVQTIPSYISKWKKAQLQTLINIHSIKTSPFLFIIIVLQNGKGQNVCGYCHKFKCSYFCYQIMIDYGSLENSGMFNDK